MTPRHAARSLWHGLCSLKLAVACLALLMVLVALCTVSQVDLGPQAAVDRFIRSAFVWWTPAGWRRAAPILPGGGLVGAVLLLNLIATQTKRCAFEAGKAGLWLIHAGLIGLFAGEFVTGFFQVETQLAIEEGQTRDYTESPRRAELAVVDAGEPGFDEIFAVPQAALEREGRVSHPRLPFTLLVKRYYRNSTVEPAASAAGGAAAGLPSLATAGPGRGLRVLEAARDLSEERPDQPSAFVEAVAGDRTLGTWLVSYFVDEPQGFEYLGRRWTLSLRPERHPLPFLITLKDFRHDRYPGTDIPKNFSSLVRLVHPERSEDRDVLIYMNNPLRYEGRTFYQASFGKGDTLSVLQVVENPGWRLPYLALALVTAGLAAHFALKLKSSRAARGPDAEPERARAAAEAAA